jgi:hypothetical protein
MDWGLLATSIGLVVATVGLAFFTKRLADEASLTRTEMKATREEMEESRRLSVRPHLMLGVSVPVPTYGFLTLNSLGPGAALEINLQISYEPGGFHRRWEWPTMAAGEVHEFLLPADNGQLDNAVRNGLVASVTGTYKDVLGDTFSIDHEMDFASWWRIASQADRRLAQPPIENIAKSMEKVAKSVEKMTR